ncbi:MAG: alkaline phosphatase family protein [Lachnospiraceae bacterium]|nr:alkaline phosphatase family protein [Lachnospiraceae bacterium]
MEKKLVWPDYNNCIANLPNSILKKFNANPVGATLPLLDKYLEKDYKNIVVILLDGMGKVVLENHLKENGPFRSHLAGIYSSVFLSTTVAATTSVMSGLQPCEHSWLGWDCYYPIVDKNVTVFMNVVQDTDEPAADFNVPWTVTPYENIVDRINRFGGKAYMTAPFLEPHPQSLEEICTQIKEWCKEPDQKYIYAYWNKPDGALHRHGLKSDEVHKCMLEMEEMIKEMAEELSDTLIVVTADHGHIDNDMVVLQDYPQLCDCLVRKPSLEPRVLNFFVKEEKNEFFKEEFNRLFGEKFLLMPVEEVIEKNLFGTGKLHEQFRGMLGDYLAIATSDLTIYFNDERWVSMHGSVTEEEMLIPLIVFNE